MPQKLLAKAVSAAIRATGLRWQGRVLLCDGTISLELCVNAPPADASAIRTEDLNLAA
jgi:hypothetical protein